MRKILFTIAAVFLFTACQSTAKVQKSKAEKSRYNSTNASTCLVTDRYYELVGIQTDSNFLVLEPNHGNGGLILFGADGMVHATSGINLGNGSYTYKPAADFSKLEIKQLGVTRMAGENDEANYFDALFFRRLISCQFIKINGDVIDLYDKDKVRVLSFMLKGIFGNS